MAQDKQSNEPQPPEQPLPQLFIAGDSTAAPHNGNERMGWGVPFSDYFDPEKVEVHNMARGGRSSRTFITEGHWDRMLADVHRGDVVLIQFGHNDGGAINREPPGSDRPLRARGSLPGLGDESEEIDNAVTGRHEVVYTYGHYLRQMIKDVREKGAQPVLMSLTVRNIWNDGRLERGAGQYGSWAYELAKQEDVPFVDVTDIAADKLEPMGPEAMSKLYPADHTHTGPEGARLHAEAVVAGLKGLRPSPIEGWLSDQGEAVEKHDITWLNLPRPARADLPTLFLIGDSTVRNGRGDGSNGQWGWGDYVDYWFNENKINVVNRAVGGLSSRTYYTGPFWDKVLDMLQPGDYVMMQFGHNDNIALNDAERARGTIHGVGDETEEIDNMVTGKHEVVHTYGWYLRQFIEQAREKGATPIMCSLVPRKIWNDEGKIERSEDSYADWAEQVARDEDVPFVNLNDLIADRYDALGKKAVDPLFGDAHTHTSERGAILNAECVAEGLVELDDNPLAPYMTVDLTLGQPVSFTFGDQNGDAIAVEPSDAYTSETGFGYDLGTMPNEGEPYFFSVRADDGNYRVTIEFGAEDQASANTVKAETRRLMVEDVQTEPGQFVERSFVVNVRDTHLVPPEKYAPGGTEVLINDREVGKLHWDDKLTLELNGDAPQVHAMTFEAMDVPTVYLIGDSTVTDQPYEPAASWGQMLTRFLGDGVAVANHAESGETMKSFITGLRLAKVLEDMGKGDYLFIQFTHNDQKEYWPQTYVEADTTYKAYLKVMIEEARRRGATPVLVTSMQRRNFDDDGKIVSSLGDYPKAMRDVAREEDVTLIDLERMSVKFYEALGPDKAPLAFNNEGKDPTHHDNYGAYELAKCVAEGIRESDLPLADHLRDDFQGFDPSEPDDVDRFDLAPSPFSSDLKPLGN
ncbi:MAG: GDSL family lipase [Puniceicoccaceae bacterium 5H]|nr:MAG: GDSL family lipase [Puniceicoccaceae bacterium 5H]